MGGKSRKTGGISLKLVRRIAKEKNDECGSKNPKKQQQIAQLTEKALEHHKKAQTAFRTTLLEARRCGKTLLELKELVDHGSWKEYLQRHGIKYERARDYMKLAKEWNHPRLKDARKNGIELGIYGALAVVREAKKEEKRKPEPFQANLDQNVVDAEFEPEDDATPRTTPVDDEVSSVEVQQKQSDGIIPTREELYNECAKLGNNIMGTATEKFDATYWERMAEEAVECLRMIDTADNKREDAFQQVVEWIKENSTDFDRMMRKVGYRKKRIAKR